MVIVVSTRAHLTRAQIECSVFTTCASRILAPIIRPDTLVLE